MRPFRLRPLGREGPLLLVQIDLVPLHPGDLDKVAKIDAWRVHDLRRTGRSEMARLKVDDVVAERVLNHLPRGLARVYNQYQYLPEKREAMNIWARELQRITKPAKGEVVRLRKRA